MPKVLRIINRLNLGGPTLNAAYLTKYLSPEYETMLVSGMKDESEASSEFILDQLGIKPMYIKEMHREIHPIKDIAAYKKIKNIIQEYKPDIVHTHAAKAGTVGRLAAAACGVPVIVHTFHGHVFHSYFSPLKTKLFIGIEQYLAKKSTGIIAISEKQKLELAQEFKIAPEEKFNVIPLGFDLTKYTEYRDEKRKQFRDEFKIAENEIAISIVGRLVPIKNHALFLKAFAKAKQNANKKIKAIIVGDGELRTELEQLTNSLNLKTANHNNFDAEYDVMFASWRKDIDVVNAGSDIIALSSNNEGTPVSLIEAQAADKPIVTTRVGGVENIVAEGNGILVNPGDENGFSEALLKLINNDALRFEMSQNGWSFVREKFHYTRLVNDMNMYYKQLLNK